MQIFVVDNLNCKCAVLPLNLAQTVDYPGTSSSFLYAASELSSNFHDLNTNVLKN